MGEGSPQTSGTLVQNNVEFEIYYQWCSPGTLTRGASPTQWPEYGWRGGGGGENIINLEDAFFSFLVLVILYL